MIEGTRERGDLAVLHGEIELGQPSFGHRGHVVLKFAQRPRDAPGQHLADDDDEHEDGADGGEQPVPVAVELGLQDGALGV